MKPRLSIKNTSGFTLIEMMMGIGILGIIAVGLVRFTSNYERGQARATAKDFSVSQNKLLLSFLERDFKFQTGFAIQNNGLTLELTRRKSYLASAPDDTYQVTFRTRCVDIPGNIEEVLEKVYRQANRNLIFQNQPCLQRLAASCPNGRYPEVFIDVDETDPRVPGYNPNNFPNLASDDAVRAMRKGTVGSALCVNQNGNKVHVTTSSIYLTGSVNGDEPFAIRTDEILLSTGNVAGVTLLPNE